MTMSDAVARYVPDGSSVAISLALEPLIPFAAAHEIIRQQRRNLTLIGPISDILFDQLIGAGCVEKVTAAWAGNVSEGSPSFWLARALTDRDLSDRLLAQGVATALGLVDDLAR